MVKRAIEKLYIGLCTVTEYKKTINPKSKITKSEEVIVLKDIPCRLSFKNITSSNLSYGNAISQEIKLFISPEIDIKDGSKITITQNGVTADYCGSGKPAVYKNHKEIILDLFKGWA